MKKPEKKVRVSPNEFFKDENDFSDTLFDDLEEIGDILGLSLEGIEREAKVGPYFTDILAKIVTPKDDEENREHVIIENQFNRTDHDHLGKQLVYAAKYNAKIVIWISDEFDEQHIEALRWLNQISGNNVYFFGIKFELFKIGSSPIAMELKPEVIPLSYSPNEISGKHAHAPHRLKRRVLWEKYKELAEAQSISHGIKPTYDRNLRVGYFGNDFQLWLTHWRGDNEMAIHVMLRRHGRKKEEQYDKQVFEKLETQKTQIEKELGMELEWEPPTKKGESRYYISTYKKIGDMAKLPDKELDEMAKWLASTSKKIMDTLPKYEE